MSLAYFLLARAGRAERQIIEAMRAVHAGIDPNRSLPEPACLALGDLMKAVERQGYEIRAPHAAYASSDELRLLGWLALCQRGYRDPSFLVDHIILSRLEHAAAALKATHRLPYQAILRNVFATAEPSADDTDRSPDASLDRSRHRSVRPSSLMSRAVAYAREHGRVSTRTLGEIGLSRQYLSLLCLKGVLVRVCHGYYEAPPLGRTQADHSRLALQTLDPAPRPWGIPRTSLPPAAFGSERPASAQRLS